MDNTSESFFTLVEEQVDEGNLTDDDMTDFVLHYSSGDESDVNTNQVNATFVVSKKYDDDNIQTSNGNNLNQMNTVSEEAPKEGNITFVVSPKGSNSENADIPKGNSDEEMITVGDKSKVSDNVDVPIGYSLEESDTVSDKSHVSEKLEIPKAISPDETNKVTDKSEVSDKLDCNSSKETTIDMGNKSQVSQKLDIPKDKGPEEMNEFTVKSQYSEKVDLLKDNSLDKTSKITKNSQDDSKQTKGTPGGKALKKMHKKKLLQGVGTLASAEAAKVPKKYSTVSHKKGSDSMNKSDLQTSDNQPGKSVANTAAGEVPEKRTRNLCKKGADTENISHTKTLESQPEKAVASVVAGEIPEKRTRGLRKKGADSENKSDLKTSDHQPEKAVASTMSGDVSENRTRSLRNKGSDSESRSDLKMSNSKLADAVAGKVPEKRTRNVRKKGADSENKSNLKTLNSQLGDGVADEVPKKRTRNLRTKGSDSENKSDSKSSDRQLDVVVKPGRNRSRRGVTEESEIQKKMKQVPDLKSKEEMPGKKKTQRSEKGKPVDGKDKTSKIPVISNKKRNTENVKAPIPQKKRATSKGLVAETSVSVNAKVHNQQGEKVKEKTVDRKLKATVQIEHWRKAVELQNFISTMWPEVEFVLNQQKPRRGSFEIKIVKDDGTDIEVWSGLNKGPPRKLKFKEPQELVEMMEKHLPPRSSKI